MKKLLIIVLLTVFTTMQAQQKRAAYIYEKIKLDESPEPHTQINQVPIFIEYALVSINSTSSPRIYVLDTYPVTEAKLQDGMTYKIIKAKKFIITPEIEKFGNRTYRLQIILPEGEANYEVVEIIQQ